MPIDEAELEDPRLLTLVKLVYNSLARFFHDPIAMIIGSAFFTLMLWGQHGELELLGKAWPGWLGPGSDPAQRDTVLPGIPWDQEWVSFLAGVVLVVGLPAVLITKVFRQRLSDYGLGLPAPGRRRLAVLSAVALLAVSAPAFWIGAHDADMRATYPLFRDFGSDLEFALYELGYLAFFVAIEFIFRGYLLFGLFQFRDRDAAGGVVGERGPLVFGYYAILISMLSYTAWHFGKPLIELWGTLLWGILAGTVALATRTIWPVIVVHWLLNVFMDLVIYKGW